MREGQNTSKERLLPPNTGLHRAIIPLYIPHENGYYAQSYSIFETCLRSLHKTSVTAIKVSVISNGSCSEVNTRLMGLSADGFIDELIIENENIGKINSILKALRTTEERLITVTDADVLFLNGWEDAVFEVFEAFPKAGAICPVPVFRKHNNFTHNIWFDSFFSNRLIFEPVSNPLAMERFAKSIGWSRLDTKFKDVMLTLTAKNGSKAMVGCSHFVATYKREVFEALPKGSSQFALGGDSETRYLDEPVVRFNGYRLSTIENYAYHMGNKLEPFMKEEFDTLVEVGKKEISGHFEKLSKSYFSYVVKMKLFKKFMAIKTVKRWFYKQKGLNGQQLKHFLGEA